MRAEKGFSNLVLAFVAVLLLGSVAFISISPINLNAAAPPASDGRAQNTSPSISLGGSGDAEYLIITRPMFESALENLVELKSQRMSVGMVTVEDIRSNYSGDIPEQIRNCILDYYNNRGTKWVLLAGDADPDDVGNNDPTLDEDWEVPVRYVEYHGEDVPTDQYYADLDDDGAAEVYVGRFPGRTAPMIENIVQKTVTFEENPSDRRHACFFSSAAYGGLDEERLRGIVDTSVEPSWLEAHEYYESDGTLDENTFVNVVNAYDPIVINAAGHGNLNSIHLEWGEGGPYVDSLSLLDLTNTGFLMYSTACSTNMIDDHNLSLGEWMLFGRDWGDIGGSNGAVGYIGAIRVTGNVPYGRFFAELLKNREYRQGAAFYKSNPPPDYMLLGDPELEIINPPHGAEVRVAPQDKSGLPGETLTYTVTVWNIGNFTDTYALTVDDDAGWNPSISPTSLEIPVNENRTATLRVTIPESVMARVADNITITATLTENAEVHTSAKCIAYAAREPTDDACVGTASGKINLYVGVDGYGDLHRSFLKFNLGDLPEDVVIEKASLNLYCWSSYNSPQIEIRAVEDDSWSEDTITWSNQPNPGSLINKINVNESWNSWDVTSWVREQYQGDGVASFCLKSADEGANRIATSYSKEQGHEYSPYLIVTFNQAVRDVDVSISPSVQSGTPGATLTFTVTVTNTGDVEDTYDLSVSDSVGWDNIRLDDDTLTVPAGENRTTTLRVHIPEDAELGTEDLITVTATSQEDAEASDSASCIAYAGLRMVIYPSVDISTNFGFYDENLRTQLKFNASSIPPEADIVSARLWLYRYRNSGGDWDGGVTVNRVDNQTWDESITADQFNSQLLTTQQEHEGKWMSDGWDYVNVIDQLGVDHGANNTYTSLMLRWTGDDGTQPVINCCATGALEIGSSYPNEPSISFHSSEYSDPTYHPYLMIGYDVSTWISPNYYDGLPGGTLTYTVNVWNTKSFADNYDLYLENRGYETTLSPNRFEDVQPMEIRTATLTFKIPEGAPIGDYDDILVTAVSERSAEEYTSWCIWRASSHVSAWEDSTSKGRDEPPHHLENSLWGRASTIDVGRYEDGPERGWLKFDLRAFPAGMSVVRANLSLNCYSTDGANVRVHGVDDDDWSEYTIHWLNKPSIGSVLDTRAVFEEDKRYSWDITSFVASEYAGDKVASFCLVDIGENIAPDHAALFSSKEYKENMPYLEILAVLPDREVRAYVEPIFQGGRTGDTLTYAITVMNKGTLGDNYDLAIESTEPWPWTLDDTLLEVPAGENRTTTLSVPIPSGDIGTFDYITITATSQENPEIYDKARCSAHRSEAKFVDKDLKPRFPDTFNRLRTLYEVWLDINVLLREDSSELVLKFYTWGGTFQGENVVWSTTPAHLEDVKDIPHPQGKVAVEKVELVLRDAQGVPISTLSTLVVRRWMLETRFMEIPGEWFLAPPAGRITLELEFSAIPGKWFLAPS